MRRSTPTLPLDASLLKPGVRLAVGLSGGADSVALLCALAERSRELGLVLHAAHLHHGLRGGEADSDLAFARELAGKLGVTFHEARVDTAAEALRTPQTPLNSSVSSGNLASDSIEATARRLRYAWFRQIIREVPLDAVATAHTLDDQAETVLAKFLRGAWTEGLSGIHPVLSFSEGPIIRPFLQTTRQEIEVFLHSRNQPWREDSTNRHLTFTRNRIRHELLPSLETWNPRLRDHLTQMAELARDEEAWWQSEIPRIASTIILRGRPVRGGGRASTTAEGIALDIARLVAEPIALQRRILRYAASQLGASPDYAATETIRELTLTGKAGRKLELSHGLRAERTHRELRLSCSPSITTSPETLQPSRYECVVPCVLDAPTYGYRIRLDFLPTSSSSSGTGTTAVLRSWKPGDRVHLRYSSGPRRVKEVLERMKVTGRDRVFWPVLEVGGHIRWMRGVELEPDPDLRITIDTISAQDSTDTSKPWPDSADSSR
ncbi:MAG: tRNA lysidine(34) synthetase TilS [Acidobacteria bacterium]|nr:tRNA lysidine(34) synthetase TilS [Acidobacteriota bacterium]